MNMNELIIRQVLGYYGLEEDHRSAPLSAISTEVTEWTDRLLNHVEYSLVER